MCNDPWLARFVFLVVAYFILMAFTNFIRALGPGWHGRRPTRADAIFNLIFYSIIVISSLPIINRVFLS